MSVSRLKNRDSSVSGNAVFKALEVLSSFGVDERSMSVGDISRITGLSSSTVHRVLQTLEACRFIEQDPRTRRYRLSLRVIELSYNALSSLELRNVSIPVMSTLARASKASAVNLGVLSDYRITRLARIESSEDGLWVGAGTAGSRTFAHATALGKAVLAYSGEDLVNELIAKVGLPRLTDRTLTDPVLFKEELARVREMGYATDIEEFANGMCCLAAPVRDDTSEVIGAISVAKHKVSFTEMGIDQLALLVLDAAAQISFRMGFQG